MTGSGGYRRRERRTEPTLGLTGADVSGSWFSEGIGMEGPGKGRCLISELEDHSVDLESP